MHNSETIMGSSSSYMGKVCEYGLKVRVYTAKTGDNYGR